MGIVTSKGDSVPTTLQVGWREQMRRAIRDPVELCRRLELPKEFEKAAVEAARGFPLFAPIPFVDKMRIGDANDPLLRQILPLGDELREAPGFVSDPLDEEAATQTPGLLKKYQGRVLMVTTGVCAVHCRYCFRRHFPYEAGPPRAERWDAALDWIRGNPSIEEVLLSGGDPLTLDDERLSDLAAGMAAIPHLKRLRIHTRLPIVIPQRVNDELIDWLSESRLAPFVVVHANHPRELDGDVFDSLRRFVRAGVTVLNQAVLLAGVNDSLEIQESLCRRLIDCQVLPYYLHQMDRVAGTSHFETAQELGEQIVAGLRERLPGYAVPRFVREIPGVSHKWVIA